MAWPTKTDFVDGDVLNASQMNNIGTNLNIFNPTSATAGQVWTANGSGSGSYQAPASGGMTSLATGTLSGTTITLSSISSAYNDLILELYGATATTGNAPEISVNNSTGNYVGVGQANNNNTRTEQNSTYTYAQAQFNAFATTGGQNYTRFYIPNYNNVVNRCLIIVECAFAIVGGTTYAVQQVTYNKRDLAAAVNRIDIYNGGYTYTGGTYRLWGVK